MVTLRLENRKNFLQPFKKSCIVQQNHIEHLGSQNKNTLKSGEGRTVQKNPKMVLLTFAKNLPVIPNHELLLSSNYHYRTNH